MRITQFCRQGERGILAAGCEAKKHTQQVYAGRLRGTKLCGTCEQLPSESSNSLPAASSYFPVNGGNRSFVWIVKFVLFTAFLFYVRKVLLEVKLSLVCVKQEWH